MQDGVAANNVRVGADPYSQHARWAPSRNTARIHAGLAQIIEDQILPRLALAHQQDRQVRAPAPQSIIPERVSALVHWLIGSDPSDSQVSALLDEGLPLDALLLDLLAPAARHLGRLWEEDEADFVEVTVALGRLHGLACTLCVRMERAQTRASARRILLMPCPGETHLFSLALVASFFREAGWDVVLLSGVDQNPATLIQAERFDLIGISLSCDVLLPVMTNLVANLRAASCNPGIRVMVGGPLFLRDPANTTMVGADAAADDGRSAVAVAEALLA